MRQYGAGQAKRGNDKRAPMGKQGDHTRSLIAADLHM
jgi:hypothetical protein